MTTSRVLPADVYDALELSAWAHGGIGAGRWNDFDHTPLCAYGHALFAEGDEWNADGPWEALGAAGISNASNDHAVRAINKRHGAPLNARVPFSKWRAELNVVRGS